MDLILYFFFVQDIIGGDEESNCSTVDSKNDRVPKSCAEPPKKRSRSKSVGIEDKVVMDRGGLTASVVVAPSNDPTQPLSVVQVRGFFEIWTEPRTRELYGLRWGKAIKMT